jgi:competence protein ComEC
MLADGDRIEADVLKVPHHGGDTSIPAFYQATLAQVGVVSVGPNTYGHPNPSVLEDLRQAGIIDYRTDLVGEITVRFTDTGGVAVGSAAG